jgi:hypothetical protein
VEIYKTKIKHISGTSYREVYSQAKFLYKQIESKTKRKPYVRSKYFKGEKVFLDYFWDHIGKKKPTDRFRRLRQYECALDLMRNSRIKPETKDNPNDSGEILHRFTGINGNNEIFCVQITQEKKSGKKYFLSVFPYTSP